MLFRTRRIVDMELDKVGSLLLFVRLFHSQRRQGVRAVARRVNGEQLHVGVVDCEQPFCREAFGMKDFPVLVLFHSGVWSVGEMMCISSCLCELTITISKGTTWVFTLPRLEWKGFFGHEVLCLFDFVEGDDELNIQYIVDFALGNYKLKVRRKRTFGFFLYYVLGRFGRPNLGACASIPTTTRQCCSGD